MSSFQLRVPEGLLSQYRRDLHPSRIEPPPNAGFSGASVFRLQCDAGEFCLRAWPPESLPRERILGLHHILRFLFEAGVSTVAVPVASQHDETLVAAEGRLWQMEPWLPGTADYWQKPSHDRLQGAMRALADWHRAAAGFIPSGREADWFASTPSAPSPAVAERLRLIRSFRGGRCDELRAKLTHHDRPEFRELGLQTLRAFDGKAGDLEHQLVAFHNLRFALQPCLRDVWHDHVLFTGDEVTGLIDPSACRSENVATDLARLIGSLVGDDRTRWDIALEAYNQARPLSLDERALVHVLDRSGMMLSAMNWLDRILIKQQGPPDRTRVEERLRTIVRRLECL